MSEPVSCHLQPEDGCHEHENTQFAVSTSIQSFKFGGFELITFREKIDISHESGERALELHDNLVSSVNNAILRSDSLQRINFTEFPISIEVDTSRFLQPTKITTGSSGLMGFENVKGVKPRSIWYLRHALYPNAYLILDSRKTFHWMCGVSNQKLVVSLEENYHKYQMNTVNWFFIDRMTKQITPYGYGNQQVFGFSSIPPVPHVSLPVDEPNCEGVGLTASRMY